jgi:hypothetical protein
MGSEPPEEYLSYLLRLWKTASEEPEAWRTSLEEPLTGLRRNFISADALFAFLRRQMALRSRGSDREGGDSEHSTE